MHLSICIYLHMNLYTYLPACLDSCYIPSFVRPSLFSQMDFVMYIHKYEHIYIYMYIHIICMFIYIYRYNMNHAVGYPLLHKGLRRACAPEAAGLILFRLP